GERPSCAEPHRRLCVWRLRGVLRARKGERRADDAAAGRYPGDMAKPNSVPDYATAHRHLSRRDAVLKRLIREHGPCTLRYDPDGFSVLCRSIVAQQISSKAAISISARLMASLPRKRLTPQGIAGASDATLRA